MEAADRVKNLKEKSGGRENETVDMMSCHVGVGERELLKRSFRHGEGGPVVRWWTGRTRERER